MCSYCGSNNSLWVNFSGITSRNSSIHTRVKIIWHLTKVHVLKAWSTMQQCSEVRLLEMTGSWGPDLISGSIHWGIHNLMALMGGKTWLKGVDPWDKTNHVPEYILWKYTHRHTHTCVCVFSSHHEVSSSAPHILSAMLLCLTTAHSNEASWPWTETSETSNLHKSFLQVDFLRHSVTATERWLI